MVIQLECLLFAPLVPLIPFFAMIFFWLKYLIDKYHLTFTYFKKIEGGGRIKDQVRNYMQFNIYFYMVVISTFFYLEFGMNFHIIGAIAIVVWTALICLC